MTTPTICAWETKNGRCKSEINPKHMLCRFHWLIVPLYYREKLQRAWSLSYLTAARRMIKWWIDENGHKHEKKVDDKKP